MLYCFWQLALLVAQALGVVRGAHRAQHGVKR